MITIIENKEEFLKENPKKDMNKLEIYGAIYMLYLLTKDSEHETSIETINDITYYCNKTLQICDGLYIAEESTLILESVFMLGNNKEDIFGLAFYIDYEEDLFLVRLS